MITLKNKKILEKVMRKLPKNMTKNELIDWFLNEDYDRQFTKLTVIELIQVAKNTGIKVKGYERCEELDVKKLEREEKEKLEMRNKLQYMYRDKKMTVKDIAAEIGTSRDTVYYLFSIYNINQKKHEYTKEYIEKLYHNYSLKEIESEFHICHKTLYKFLNIYNIPRKSTRGRKRAA